MAVGSLPHHIDVNAGMRRAEFGRGFYVTTWRDQAFAWANKRTRLSRSRGGAVNAVVLSAAVSRDRLAELEALVFTNEHCGFWSFVAYCRSGARPHARTTAGGRPEYDLVYGPMSAGPHSSIVFKDCDQISFHTANAVSIIPSLQLEAKGSPFV